MNMNKKLQVWQRNWNVSRGCAISYLANNTFS